MPSNKSQNGDYLNNYNIKAKRYEKNEKYLMDDSISNKTSRVQNGAECFLNCLKCILCRKKLLFKTYSKRSRRAKLLTILFFLSIIIYSYYIFIHSNNKHFFNMSYDLFEDALRKQNITSYKIMCDSSQMSPYYYYYDMESVSQLLCKKQLDKRTYFNKYYLNSSINHQSHSKFDIRLNPDEFMDYNLIRVFNSLKICATSLRAHFESSLISNNNIDLYTLFSTKNLTRRDFKKLQLNIELLPGGLHRPPNCLQDFFYFVYNYKSVNEELARKALINIEYLLAQSTNQSNSKVDLNNLVENISITSTPLVKQILLNDPNSFDEFLLFNEKLTVVIIPFMNRQNNLIELLYNLHPFLQRQYVHYRIVVAEQVNTNDPFNKGRLYNAAIKHMQKLYKKIDCLLLHDVDLVPESDLNFYECDNLEYAPRHLSMYIRKEFSAFSLSSYEKSPYELLVGGVLAIKPNIYKYINGFSNDYWYWGAEDDDLAMRMIFRNVCIKRPDKKVALYKMLNHTESIKNPIRTKLLFSSVKRIDQDGLSCVHKQNTSVISVQNFSLFTLFKIDVGKRSQNYFAKYNISV